VVSTSSVAVDFFDKARFRFIAGILSILLWETDTGGKGDVLPFYLIISHIVSEFFVGRKRQTLRR
jgi:hypothetical protein